MLLLAALLAASSARAADFVGGGVGDIPDGDASGLTISFTVSGVAHPITDVRLSLDINHGWTGDLDATLVSPAGKARLLVFGRSGVSRDNTFGTGGNLSGVYRFSDRAASDWWSAFAGIVDDNATIPTGTYRTSTGGTTLSQHGGCATSLAGAFNGLSGADANGTWTLTIADRLAGYTGSVAAATLSVLDDHVFGAGFDPFVRGDCRLAQLDFTGTGRTSFAVVRPTAPGPTAPVTWLIQDNDGTTSGAVTQFDFGIATDFFLGGDFDGDGLTDAAIWTPATGTFSVRRSSRPGDAPLTIALGASGDDPQQIGDYDGDGLDDAAVYHHGATAMDPSHLLIRLTRSGAPRDIVAGEGPVGTEFAAGGIDYSGDGRADVAVQSDGGGGVATYRIYDGTSGTLVDTFNFGTTADSIAAGDHVGSDRRADITGVYPSGANLFWATRDTATGLGYPAVDWGLTIDKALSGDYDGDGLDDYAVWRPNADPAQTFFYSLETSKPGQSISVNFGQSGDYPIANSRVH